MDKRLLFIANFKSNKTVEETIAWLETFKNLFNPQLLASKEIVVCPSAHALFSSYEYIKAHNLPISLGVQNVSPFEEGAYTGEIAASQIKDMCQYCIIGHSERRVNFSETDDVIEKKIKIAKSQGLQSILCVQDENTPVFEEATIVAYEPPFAIGSGTADTPEHIEEVLSSIAQKSGKEELLYGGSVKAENISQFESLSHVKGFLIGSASWDASSFLELLSK